HPQDTETRLEDRVGAMFSGNTETFISVTYGDEVINLVVPVLDENDMASNLDTVLATQQSIKAYADALHALQYLKTEIDELSELEAIWSKDVTDSSELATALADFTGQENIVTLGTIGTGTWEGTAIADGYIPDDITITESDPNALLTAGTD
ncbi:unnamed protein product, partial [marine sediment metagenome]